MGSIRAFVEVRSAGTRRPEFAEFFGTGIIKKYGNGEVGVDFAGFATNRVVPRWGSCRDIRRVIFSGPATIVFWDDGTKTVVKCQEGDNFDYQTGILLCIVKKNLCGNDSGEFNRYIHTNVFGHLPEDNIPDTFDTED